TTTVDMWYGHCVLCFFFFSSRRRHTRCLSVWSSDVCSSDLSTMPPPLFATPPIGRQALGVVAKSGGRIVLAGLRDGLYRSEDGGETWTRANHDPRITPVGVVADPTNPDLVYVTQTALYRSTDGGRTFDAFAGAPSGDDLQLLWIDPRNSRRLLAGVDQGAIVSVDAGASWSSWYNQPTGQFYHVVTDD